MEVIEHTYTIQWVGPMGFDDYQEYINRDDNLNSGLFNFYYYEATKYGKPHRYIGIHKKNDGIEKRLNEKHEHFGKVKNAKDLKIWIGSFANAKNQKEENVDLVETLFIRAYKDKLTDNEKKKKSLPGESICIINMWFDDNNNLKKYAIERPSCMDDVLLYYNEEPIFMRGNLRRLKISDEE